MKKIIGCSVVGGLLLGASAFSDMDFEIDESQATVITATKLTFDQIQQYALFEENVEVTDPSIHMTADRMTVFFSEDNRAEGLEAVGRVVITQEDTKAWAQKATYDVVSGKIVLTGNPRIRRGRDLLEGDVITFWRDDNRMICEPRARLVLFPDDDSGSSRPRGSLLGE
jgi:lipopolysaccharide export system protein LptA